MKRMRDWVVGGRCSSPSSGCSPWGSSGASPAPSPRTRRRRRRRREQGHPAARLDERPRQPQPVHRLRVVVLRDLVAELRPARRLPRLRPHEPAGHRPGHRLGDVRRRQGLDVHDHRQGHLAGRRAGDGGRRRVHLQLRDRQRDGHVHRLHARSSTRSRRRTTPTSSSRARKPKANMLGLWMPILPEHVWSKVDPRRRSAPTRTPRRSSAPAPSRRVECQEGRVRPDGGLRELLEGRPQDRRGHLPDIPEQRHHGAGPQGRRPRTAPGTSRRPSSTRSTRART